MNQNNVQKCLKLLQHLGWSDLIDSRWEQDVINTLKGHFNNLSEEDIKKVLKLVIYEG